MKKDNLIKRILIELDKGGYDNFEDRGLLTLELMRDFKISNSSANYVTTAYWHYKYGTLLKRDVEIAKLQGELWAFTKEVRRLHLNDCNCITCEGK